MRILQITPQLPYPPDSGGRVGIYNILKHLARRHTMTLVSFVTEETEGYVSELSGFCDRIITVRRRAGKDRMRLLTNLFSTAPYTIAKFHSGEMRRRLRETMVSLRVDLAHIDHLHMAQYVDALPADMPVVLREHNVESRIMSRFAEQTANPFIRGYARIQSQRLFRYESVMLSRFDRCVAVTDTDREALSRMAPSARIEVTPAGVDTELFHPDAVDVRREPMRLVTTGDYGWRPTADGLTCFVRDIYPLIRQAIPEVTLSVVGRNPPDWIRRIASEQGIDVRGRVEDVRVEILRGSVFVTPTRIGSGIRLKILEAMALHRPVVSTTVGCEGIEAVNGDHLLVADDPASFADAVIRLLKDRALERRLVERAATLIQSRYAWNALADQLSAIYEEALHERRKD
jgi:sugar transferase (PEP-CTERM/EpsH1 system associated)